MKVSRLLLSYVLLAAAAFAQDAEPVRPEADRLEGQDASFTLAVTELPPGKEEKPVAPNNGEQRRLARLLAMIKEGESLDSPDLVFLRRHREATVTALRAELKVGWKKAGTALETLMSLGVAEARAQWFAEFQKGNMETREELLAFRTEDESGNDLIFPRNREEEEVFRTVLEPKQFIVGAAFRICHRPGVVALLLDLLPEFPREEQWSIVGVITDGVWTPEEGRRVLAWAKEQARIVREEELTALQETVAEIMGKRGETLVEAEKLFLELHAREPEELLRSDTMASAFCKGATPASRAVLDRLFKESKAPGIRGYALRAITRQRGPEVLADLEPLAADSKHRYELWDTLTFLAESGAHEKVNAFVLRHFPKLDELGIGYVLRYGNAELLRRAEERVTDVDPETRFALEWKLKGRTLAGFFQRLKERKLIDRVPTEQEIAETTATSSSDESVLESDRVLRLLEVLDARLKVDSEADEMPAPYGEVFDRFAQFTRGMFSPLGLEQRAEKPASPEEEPPVIIEFTMASKRFTLKPRSMGDWYDLEAAQAAVNRALEVAGRNERLLAVENSSQVATYVFGSPVAWREVAKEYAFPLAAEASDAARKGKKFEKRVIEALDEPED